MTNRQNEILKYLATVDMANKESIYKNVSFSYYHNWEKHLGELLSKMVKAGKIERVNRGIFKIGKSQAVRAIVDPQQKSLF